MAQQHIGHYEVLSEVAKGAQATVYRARDLNLDRVVALKVLHPHQTGDPQFRERFLREARMAASLTHPNVVTIYDVGEHAGQLYMTMEYLPESLHSLIEAESRLSVERAVHMAIQISSALQAAHEHGIVHRDIKPHNILISPGETMKVADFGIARAADLSTMTRTGAIMGTPHYMSPEQARGERADIRSDIYALGVVLYQMLTGEVPFDAETPLAVLEKHRVETPPRVRQIRGDVPLKVDSVVERCLAKGPAERFESPAQLARALERALPGTIQNMRLESRPATPQLALVTDQPQVASHPSTPRSTLPTVMAHRQQAPATPAPTESGTIAFVSDRDGDPELYVINVDGSGQTRLTLNSGIPNDLAEIQMTWSPDGSKIAFTSNRDGYGEVHVMNADGTGQIRLTNNSGATPAWSPDGSRIAFASYRDGYMGLYVMNADGTGQIRLTNSPDTPNGGRGLVAKFSRLIRQALLTEKINGDGMPAWSPDGTRIAFISYRDGNPEICVMNANGTGQNRLANGIEPAWSPDGCSIAFVSNRDGDGDVHVISADGTGQTRLTKDHSSTDQDPAWSPDGSRIAFTSNRDGNWDIYVMKADGAGQTRLTNNPATDFRPAWSSDGSRIAFSSNRNGNFDVYVMNADGTEQTSLTNSPQNDIFLAWSP